MNAFDSIAESVRAGCQHGAPKGDIWGTSLARTITWVGSKKSTPCLGISARPVTHPASEVGGVGARRSARQRPLLSLPIRSLVSDRAICSGGAFGLDLHLGPVDRIDRPLGPGDP